MNELSQEQIKAMQETPEYKLGYYMAIWEYLVLLEQDGVKHPNGAKIFKEAYQQYHPKHEYHTGELPPPPMEDAENTQKTKKKRAGKGTKSEQK